MRDKRSGLKIWKGASEAKVRARLALRGDTLLSINWKKEKIHFLTASGHKKCE